MWITYEKYDSFPFNSEAIYVHLESFDSLQILADDSAIQSYFEKVFLKHFPIISHFLSEHFMKRLYLFLQCWGIISRIESIRVSVMIQKLFMFI